MTRPLVLLLLAGCTTAPADRAPTLVDDTGLPSATTHTTTNACPAPTPLPRRLRRLSHREYRHTLHDLFGVTPSTPLTADPTVDGFDNDADALRVSALLADQYRVIAEQVAFEADLSPWLTCDLHTDGCAEATLPALARSVWRRPLSSTELDDYALLLDTLTADSSREDGLRWTLATLLQSPHFLYRTELGTPQPDGTHTLTAWERASALSYTLLGTTPDEALLDAAADGLLDTDAGLTDHITLLLEDPRSAEHLADLTEAWLHLGLLDTVSRVGLDDTGRAEMRADFRARVTASTTVSDLFTDGGILLEPALLTAHGVPEGTGPVQRGVMVRELLLCEPLPPPPSGVDTSAPDVDPTQSTRDRFEQHSADPLCATCHQHIDPLGFAFEHYDQLGAWRATDQGHPIDTTGHLDGHPIDGATELAAALAHDPRVATCFLQTARRWLDGTPGCTDSIQDTRLTTPFIELVNRGVLTTRAPG